MKKSMRMLKNALSPTSAEKQLVWKRISKQTGLKGTIFTKDVFFRWIRVSFWIVTLVSVVVISSWQLLSNSSVNKPIVADAIKITEFGYAVSCAELKSQLEATGITLERYAERKKISFMYSLAEDTQSIENSPDYYTTTNVQVAGIDEGDIVKTDGNYLYVLSASNRKLTISRIYPVEEAKLLGEVKFSESSPIEMFIYENNLVVFANVYEHAAEDSRAVPTDNLSKIFVFDVSKVIAEGTSEPKLIREIEVEGSFLTSRLKDGYVYMISNKNIYDYNSLIPLYRDSLNTDDYEKSCRCADIAVLDPDYVYPALTTITAIDMNSLGDEASIYNFVGNTETVYMSEANIYLVSRDMRDSGGYGNYYNTVINKLDYSRIRVNFMAATKFAGSLLNQFSLDEYNGYLRVVGTVGEVRNTANPSENFLYIFDEVLNQASCITDLARGEKIYSARFYGKTGVMVTFKKVDPLFVFDLSNPEAPVLKGELKIPGYSDYLHFIDENTVIGVGKNTAESGSNFAWYQGLKIAVFDISNLSHPREISKLLLGDRGSDSQALYDHRAFVYDTKHNRIILPVTLTEVGHECPEANCYGRTIWQGARVISISDELELNDEGGVMHSSGSVIRSVVVDDYLVTISENEVKVSDIYDYKEFCSITIGTSSSIGYRGYIR